MLMDKRYFIELTNRVYRLTLFFPKKEPLRHHMRSVADEILTDLVIILEGDPRERREAAFNVERNAEVLNTLFELAKVQKWVEERSINEIQDSYLTIQREVEEFNALPRREREEKVVKELQTAGGIHENPKEEPKEEQQLKEEKTEAREEPVKQDRKKKLNPRQEKILEMLKSKEKLQVKDIQEVIPQATKRTLRRDLGDLVEQRMIKRVGKGNVTYYQTMPTGSN